MPEIPTPVCDPATILGYAPCAQSLSESELELITLALWAIAAGFDPVTDLHTILQNSECLKMGLLGDSKRARYILTVMGSALEEQAPSPIDIGSLLSCVKGIEPGRVKNAIAWLQCQFWSNYRNL